jgi:radical SAM superfamily enzyme YgiQ (UPF0313 family)
MERYVLRGGIRWPFSIIKRKKDSVNSMFPFFQGYAAALLREQGFDVGVLDAQALNMDYDLYYNLIQGFDPKIIFIETSTVSINHDLQVAKRLKEMSPNAKIGLFGLHASYEPANLVENDDIDVVIAGEPEEAMLNYTNSILSKVSESYANGVYTKISGSGRGMTEINNLPFAARDLFPYSLAKPDMSVYHDDWCMNRPALQVQSSRGCIFNCVYCAWVHSIYSKRKYRTFKPFRVYQETEYAALKYGAKEIYFDDDDFTIDYEHAIQVAKHMHDIGLPWSMMGDVLHVDDLKLYNFKRYGLYGFKFGVESADEELVKKSGKPIKMQKVLDVAKCCRNMDIRTHATFTFGLPGETKETMQKTLDFSLSLDVDSVQYSVTTPLPGTPMYEMVKKYIIAEKWEDYDGNAKAIVSYPNLSADEIQAMCDHANTTMTKKKMRNMTWMMQKAKDHLFHRGPIGLARSANRAIHLMKND